MAFVGIGKAFFALGIIVIPVSVVVFGLIMFAVISLKKSPPEMPPAPEKQGPRTVAIPRRKRVRRRDR